VENCDGYYTWEDLMNKFNILDRAVWETQWECKKPDSEGLVYPRFDEVANVDKDFVLNLESIRNKATRIFVFEDFGYSKEHPDVILLCHVDFKRGEVVAFDELYSTLKGTDEILEDFQKILDRHGLTIKNISGWIGDPHAITEQVDRQNRRLPMLGNMFCVDKKDHLPADLYLIKNGISHVRKMIDDRAFKITPNMTKLRNELFSYQRKKQLNGKYSDEALKENDHGPDALRYGFIWLFPKQAWRSIAHTEFKAPQAMAVKYHQDEGESRDIMDIEESSSSGGYTAGLTSKVF
jgi:hypothetical protein